ncbi:MAG: SH3 domain-containing protein [Thermodesulfobacteriota bacterium]
MARSAGAGLLAALVMLMILPGQTALAGEYRSVSKDGVNLRSGPSTEAEVLWEVFQGFPLEIVDRKGQWAQAVDYEGDKAWIYLPLLSEAKTVIVKVAEANLRVGPGANYEKVVTVKRNVIFSFLEKKGDWVRVKHASGVSGWISAPLVWPSH